MRLWLCEKPDQAEKLAAVIGQAAKKLGYYETADGRVTWAVGHLLRQAQPDDYDPALRAWTFEPLPIVPAKWKMLPDDDRKAQIAVIGDLLRDTAECVIATDAGPEGESIARELLEHFRFRGGVKRLWARAVDPRTFRKALTELKDGRATEPLYWASQARSRADWLIGMNATRAYTLLARAAGEDGARHVGRVQSPTLALVVRRDREIEAFRERTYYELTADVQQPGGTLTLRHAPDEEARIFERDQAQALAQRAQGAQGALAVTQTEKRAAPPKLFSLSRLQKAASSRWGWPVDHTLEVAQALYDKGLTSYPRTGATYLPDEQRPDVPRIVEALGQLPPLARHVAGVITNGPVMRDSVFSSAEIEKSGEDHHAIAPTGDMAGIERLNADERALYLLIAQHYIAALLEDYRYAETRVDFDAAGVPFHAVGRVPLAQGWRSVFDNADPDQDGEDDDADLLPSVVDGALGTVQSVTLDAKKTRPPKRYTEGALVMDMAAIAKFATDPKIKARLRETSGIGTEATRAAIVKNLRERGYLEAQGKFIVSTARGRAHIDSLHPSLRDPVLTAVWEDALSDLRKAGSPDGRDRFVTDVATNLRRLIEALKPKAAAAEAARPPSDEQKIFAAKIGTALGIPVPPEVNTSYAACKAFLDVHARQLDALPPTGAAVAFAEKIALAAGVPLPPAARQRRDECSTFIEKHKKALDGKPVKGRKA